MGVYSRLCRPRSFRLVLVDIHRVAFRVVVNQRLDHAHYRLVHIDVSARFGDLRQSFYRMRTVGCILTLCFPDGDLRGNHVLALCLK